MVDDDVLAGNRVLFITKHRTVVDEAGYSHGGMSSGLLNSARFVAQMLARHGAAAEVVQVVDNNAIDREVHRFQPNLVIIEALWVIPEKFVVLTKLHPDVKWVVRLHSNTPFIANEGSAIEWLIQYLDYKMVDIHANAPEMFESLKFFLKEKYKTSLDLQGEVIDVDARVKFLPNFYPVDWSIKRDHRPDPKCINIGLFGAARPMKNALLQAISAMRFADSIDKVLRLHINTGRTENNGAGTLKNVRSLFSRQSTHVLVEHPWMPHAEFLEVVKQMDVCMQVSFSETQNIVTADAVNQNVPIVVSSEINWASRLSWAHPTDPDSIVSRLRLVLLADRLGLQMLNKLGLDWYSEKSEIMWLDFLQSANKIPYFERSKYGKSDRQNL